MLRSFSSMSQVGELMFYLHIFTSTTFLLVHLIEVY